MGKKVLITGADGFIGSHLTELLVSRGYDVTALAYYNSFNSWGWLEQVGCRDKIDIVFGDVSDPNFCRHVTSGIDIVFHLAALIAIPYSYVSPDSYVNTNVKGTLNICQACKDNSVDRLIHTSTSEVYGTAKYVPIDEEHPLQAQSPYSATKISADAIAMSFYNAFGLNVTIARPFNTYGPRQSARAVIPTIITQMANGEKKIKLGDVSPTRDFTYVEDTCQGFHALSEEEGSIGETVNMGSNFEISIEELFMLIKKIMNSDAEFISDEQRLRPERSEVFRLWSDNSKMSKLTGFKPEVDIETGLKKTIDWITKPENLKTYKSGLYNV